MTPEEIDKKKGRQILELEDRIQKLLRAIQKELTTILGASLAKDLAVDDGTIERSTRNLNVSLAVDDAFKRIEKKQLNAIFQIAKSISSVSALNLDYFDALEVTTPKKLKKAAERAAKETLLYLGIKPKGKGFTLVKNGFFDTVVKDNSNKQRVKQLVINAVAGNAGFSDTLAGMKTLIEGAQGREGFLERYYRTTVYDTIQQSERVESGLIAEELRLSAFIFEGTVIGATRGFCKKRAGKVFTRREARKWKNLNFEGKPKNYVPVRDLGGHNCRHRTRWISNEEAIRRRPDLFIENGKLLKVKK